jgi:hypothetical protein
MSRSAHSRRTIIMAANPERIGDGAERLAIQQSAASESLQLVAELGVFEATNGNAFIYPPSAKCAFWWSTVAH